MQKAYSITPTQFNVEQKLISTHSFPFTFISPSISNYVSSKIRWFPSPILFDFIWKRNTNLILLPSISVITTIYHNVRQIYRIFCALFIWNWVKHNMLMQFLLRCNKWLYMLIIYIKAIIFFFNLSFNVVISKLHSQDVLSIKDLNMLTNVIL